MTVQIQRARGITWSPATMRASKKSAPLLMPPVQSGVNARARGTKPPMLQGLVSALRRTSMAATFGVFAGCVVGGVEPGYARDPQNQMSVYRDQGGALVVHAGEGD